jgi:hypothetical protein
MVRIPESELAADVSQAKASYLPLGTAQLAVAVPDNVRAVVSSSVVLLSVAGSALAAAFA